MNNRNWPYAWAIVILAWSWYMTHDILFGRNLLNGDPIIEVSLITIGYALTLLRSLPKIIQFGFLISIPIWIRPSQGCLPILICLKKF